MDNRNEVPDNSGEQPIEGSVTPINGEIFSPDASFPQNLDGRGRNFFDKKPSLLTQTVLTLGINAGIISPEGLGRIKDISTEWLEMYQRRSQMRNDSETRAHLHQLFHGSAESLQKIFGISRGDFTDILEQELLAAKQKNPDFPIPEKHPLRSFVGLKYALNEILPALFTEMLAFPQIVSERADLAVIREQIRHEHTIEMDREELREEKNQLQESLKVRSADRRVQNTSTLLAAEKAIQTELALKAGRPVRVLIGLTSPFFRWPIDVIREVGTALEEFAREKPILASGAGVSLIAGVYVLAAGPSPVGIAISACPIVVGAIAQGLKDRKQSRQTQQ